MKIDAARALAAARGQYLVLIYVHNDPRWIMLDERVCSIEDFVQNFNTDHWEAFNARKLHAYNANGDRIKDKKRLIDWTVNQPIYFQSIRKERIDVPDPKIVMNEPEENTLAKIRQEWERGLNPVAEKQLDQSTYLVVLRDPKKRVGLPPYHCHRYFQLPFPDFPDKENWVVSVDGQQVDEISVFKWLMNPKALPRRGELDEE